MHLFLHQPLDDPHEVHAVGVATTLLEVEAALEQLQVAGERGRQPSEIQMGIPMKQRTSTQS